jgi:uncharacterized membrane protein
MAYCNTCGAQIADGATVCAACAGRTAAPPQPGYTTVPGYTSAPVAGSPAPGDVAVGGGVAGGMTDNVAGLLAYFTIIPAIVFLIIEPFNRNRFVRFHAWQSVFFNIAWIVLWVGLRIIAHIPFLGWLTVIGWPLVMLAGFIVWLILVLKAYQSQMFKLPTIGDMAEKQAAAM